LEIKFTDVNFRVVLRLKMINLTNRSLYFND